MPICRKCNNSFPNWIKVEGVNRSLSKRKYCLECSPYGSSNRAVLENVCENGGNHVCRVCSREYVYDRKKGHRKTICNSCNANHKRALIKKKALAYKGGKCVRCGYDKCDAALAFHHTDPSQKEFQISGSHSASWDKMMKELDKCVVLCMNCHTETHAAP